MIAPSQTNKIEWYRKTPHAIAEELHSDLKNGLTEAKVKTHREKYGSNVFVEQTDISLYKIFLSQFKSPLIYVLLLATIIVFFLEDYVDSVIIFSIIVINAIVGTFQEGKAQNTLRALRNITKSYATVIRDGESIRVSDDEIVPGDILSLKDGDAVTADARLISTNSLQINESSLTGESTLISKTASDISIAEMMTADQNNMVFRGTHVISGLARAIVVRTGAETVIGKIASKLSNLNEDVPLKKNIDGLSRVIVVAVLLLSATLFLIGISTGKEVKEMFLTVVALAVSSIPEGLPVIFTLVLSTGVWRMSKQKVLVKRMQAVEALGQANILALDKTGTITKNQMMMERFFVNGKKYSVTGQGYEPVGKIYQSDNLIANPNADADIELLARIAVLTSIAEVEYSKKDSQWFLESGDPTEAALIVFGKKLGYEKNELLKKFPQVVEMPFNLKTKHHTVINLVDDKKFLASSGSPEILLEKCEHIWADGVVRKITDKDLANISEVMREYANAGYRMIALSCDMSVPSNLSVEKLSSLTFVGIVGIIDSIRDEVYSAVKAVKDAGIKPVMITGDHQDTAVAIGRRVGIFEDGDNVITGREIDEMTVEALSNKILNTSVFARVSPEHKLKIIELYKKAGKIVAMTGDGINDALSLNAADLGVAMGIVGTEVAKESADLILLDDNFGNIVNAAEEGRNIFMIIKKSILALLATNLGEIFVISFAIIFGLPLPILAAQIIWLNLVTDTTLVTMLSFEKRENNLLKQNYRKPSRFIVDRDMLSRMFMVALIMAAGTLYLFAQNIGSDMVKAWTMALTTLTVFQWYNVFNVRSETQTVFSGSSFDNKYLLWGLFSAVLLHLIAIYTPFMNNVLSLTPLNITEWLLILVVCLPIILIEELRKYFVRNRVSQVLI